MEESDCVETGMEKRFETNKRKMMIVYVLVVVLVLAGAGALVYFYKSSSSIEEGGISLEPNKIKDEPESKDTFFFDENAREEGSVIFVRLDDAGNFSERINFEVPKEIITYFFLPRISGIKRMIFLFVDRGDEVNLYKFDLKTKMLENVLSVPYSKDQDGEPGFHFSPDCLSIAYYFKKSYCENSNWYEKKSKLVLKDLITGAENELDWGTGKNCEIIVRNGGRVIRHSSWDGYGKSVEVSLFSKEHNYQAVKLFDTQESGFSSVNNLQVSHDANRIFFVDGDQKSIVFDVPSRTHSTINGKIILPLLSPDGRKVASSVKNFNGPTNVKIFDVETSKIEKEFNLQGENDLNSWSTNSKFLFFDYRHLTKLSITDGAFEPVKDEDGKILNVSRM